MEPRFAHTTAGRIALGTTGFVFLALCAVAFGQLPLWHPITMCIPLLAGVCAMWSVGLAIADDHYLIAMLLVILYPFMGMGAVVGMFGGPGAGTAVGGVFAVIGLGLIVKAAISKTDAQPARELATA